MMMALLQLSPHPTSLHLHHILPARRNIPLPPPPHRRNIPSRRATMASVSAAAAQLLEAAKHTIDNYVTSGMVIGLGSGLSSSLAIQHLGRRLREGSLTNVLGIPTSGSSASEAEKAGIPLDKYQDSIQVCTNYLLLSLFLLISHLLMLMLWRREHWLLSSAEER